MENNNKKEQVVKNLNPNFNSIGHNEVLEEKKYNDACKKKRRRGKFFWKELWFEFEKSKQSFFSWTNYKPDHREWSWRPPLEKKYLTCLIFILWGLRIGTYTKLHLCGWVSRARVPTEFQVKFLHDQGNLISDWLWLFWAMAH